MALARRYADGSQALSGRPVAPPPFSLEPPMQSAVNLTSNVTDVCASDAACDPMDRSSNDSCSRIREWLPEPVAVHRSCAAQISYLSVAASLAMQQHYDAASEVSLGSPVLLRDGQFPARKGEDDQMVGYNIDRAEAGDARSQVWVGQQYYWGAHGLPRRPDLAYDFFQRVSFWLVVFCVLPTLLSRLCCAIGCFIDSLLVLRATA